MSSNSVNNLDVIILCICPVQFPIHPVPCQTICRTLGLLCEKATQNASLNQLHLSLCKMDTFSLLVHNIQENITLFSRQTWAISHVTVSRHILIIVTDINLMFYGGFFVCVITLKMTVFQSQSCDRVAERQIDTLVKILSLS